MRSPSEESSTRALWPVAVFTAAYLIVAVVVAHQRGNAEFLMYVGVVVVLAAAIGLVHFQVRLLPAALWCLSLWGLLHMAGGLLILPDSWPADAAPDHPAVLYGLWLIPQRLRYDHVIHAYGFGVTTWICWQGLRAAIARRGKIDRQNVRPTFGLLTLAAAAGLGFGALNEVVEFAATLLVPETNVGGYVNTGWDLVANTVGSLLAAGAIVLHDRTRTAQP